MPEQFRRLFVRVCLARKPCLSRCESQPMSFEEFGLSSFLSL